MTPTRLALAIAFLLHVLLSLWFARPVPMLDAPLPLPGASLTPYARDESPERATTVASERIDAAVAATAAFASRIRTYSVLEGQDRVPEVAARHGILVALGIWVDETEERTRAEIERAVEVALIHPNVDLIVVGNETVLMKKRRPADLVPLLREVRARTGRMVTTTEPWDIWIRMPELATEVDIIGVHILLSRTCAKVHTVLFLPRRALMTAVVSDRRDFPDYVGDEPQRSAAIAGRTRYG